tara:strand:- start:294 stop:857 length:564 start_codon:yes stop_codon:yes gene_type:complete
MEDYVNDRGFWEGGDVEHKTDEGLLEALKAVVAEQETLVDFGCGDASYSKAIAETGIKVEAYDGNPNAKEVSGGFASTLDLSEPFDLKKKFDVVMCLEVAEHLPKEYEDILIDNLLKHVNGYLIISWAIPGQGGVGHFNEQPNEYVRELFTKKGFTELVEVQQFLRNSVTWCGWFRNTTFVFYKEEN